MAADPKKTGLGKTWLQAERKEPIVKKTRQGNGIGSKPSHGRKKNRGQGR
jgi:hypothetical protein